MRFARCLVGLVAAVQLASCRDSAQLVDPVAVPDPQLRPGNAPPSSGPNVVRATFITGVLSSPELAITVGFEEPFADHCSDFDSPTQPGSTQVVFLPTDGVQERQSGQGLNVRVYELEAPFQDTCSLVASPLIATGTANFTLTANDLTFGGSGPGADQVRVTIHGIVDLTSGGQARLFAFTHVLIRPDGTFAFDHTRIRLTPL
jgi:hypothetical protein